MRDAPRGRSACASNQRETGFASEERPWRLQNSRAFADSFTVCVFSSRWPRRHARGVPSGWPCESGYTARALARLPAGPPERELQLLKELEALPRESQWATASPRLEAKLQLAIEAKAKGQEAELKKWAEDRR